ADRGGEEGGGSGGREGHMINERPTNPPDQQIVAALDRRDTTITTAALEASPRELLKSSNLHPFGAVVLHCRRRSLIDAASQHGVPTPLFFPLYLFYLVAVLLIATVLAGAAAIFLLKFLSFFGFAVSFGKPFLLAFCPCFVLALLLMAWLALI